MKKQAFKILTIQIFVSQYEKLALKAFKEKKSKAQLIREILDEVLYKK